MAPLRKQWSLVWLDASQNQDFLSLFLVIIDINNRKYKVVTFVQNHDDDKDDDGDDENDDVIYIMFKNLAQNKKKILIISYPQLTFCNSLLHRTGNGAMNKCTVLHV